MGEIRELDINKNEIDEKEVYTIFHMTEDYLDEHYRLRYNTIALDVECCKIDDTKWESLNIDSLWLEIQKKGIKVQMNALRSILKSNFVRRYDPIREYFRNLPKWDQQTDYIKQFGDYLELVNPKTEYDEFQKHFKKWLVRVVKSILIKDYFNKQAFILSDNGYGQNIGKTTYLRYLVPKKLQQYIAEDIGNDKDARILLCKNFLINMDELATLSKREINHLKAYFTKTQINERLPYDSKNTIIPRIASFMGSTNQATFLRDETGSVRWLIFSVKGINWNYTKEFNIDNLWAQAYHLANDKDFDETMTRDDIIENEKRNQQYQVLTKEQELVHKFFSIPNFNNINVEFMTATEIALYIKRNTELNQVPYEVTIGKAMHYLGYKRTQRKINGTPTYGYEVIVRPIQQTIV